jgi:hypothetical protein
MHYETNDKLNSIYAAYNSDKNNLPLTAISELQGTHTSKILIVHRFMQM